MIKLIVLLCSFTLTCSLTGQDYWEHIHSNDTSTIWSLAIAKNGTMYYGGNSGLYVSEDNGANWSFKPLLNYHYIFDLAFDLDSNLICAANHKIYKYLTNTDTWEFLFEPELNQQFYSLLVDSTYIFAGSSQGKLYKYDGDTWEKLEDNLTVGIYDIERDYDNRLIVCGTSWSGDNGAIAESSDDGETWTNLGLEDSYLFDVEVDNQNRIYAGSIGNAIYGIGGLYRYNREDNIWDTLRLYHRVQSILCTQEDSLYIGQYTSGGEPTGAYVSHDYGESWKNISSGFWPLYPNVEELTLGPDGHLYCIVQDGYSIYKSIEPIIVHADDDISFTKELISAYPNPFDSHIVVKIKSNSFENCFISLYNSRGETIINRERFKNIEKELRLEQLEKLPQNVYFLKIVSKNQTRTIKLIKY